MVSGFIKFLGPYYMLLITERREIGEICGHRVYEVAKSEIISLQNSSVLCNIANSRDENRYLDISIFCYIVPFFHSMHSYEEKLCFSFLFGEKRGCTVFSYYTLPLFL